MNAQKLTVMLIISYSSLLESMTSGGRVNQNQGETSLLYFRPNWAGSMDYHHHSTDACVK